MAPIQVPPVWLPLASAEPRRPTPLTVAGKARRNLFNTDRDKVAVSTNELLACVNENSVSRALHKYGLDILADEKREQELNRAQRQRSGCQATRLEEPFPAGVALTPSQIAATAKLIIRSRPQKPYGRSPQGIKAFYRERKAPKAISNVPKRNTSSSSNNNNNCPNNNDLQGRGLDRGNSETGTIVKKDE
ncbi:gliolectin [Drosophila subobscura]|uniref:gliolectin n=1 Tax=Drosophila subobscura TaxID=7241 RepID=UPI00155A3FE8|nr:gliolectin [Drosophila subobscura]